MGRWVDKLFSNQLTTGTSVVVQNKSANGTSVQATISGTSGAVQSSITLYGTHANAASGGVAIATITLGDGTVTSDVQEAFIPADYPFYYAIVVSISGTGASVNLYVGH